MKLYTWWWLLSAASVTHCFTVTITNFVSVSQTWSVHSLPSGTTCMYRDTHDTCAVSRYFLLLRYTAVVSSRRYRRYLPLVSTISIVVSCVSHNTTSDQSQDVNERTNQQTRRSAILPDGGAWLLRCCREHYDYSDHTHGADRLSVYTGWSKKNWYPCFNFAITFVNVCRF